MVAPWHTDMRKTAEILALSAIFLAVTCCGRMTPDQQFIRQKIPVQIQNGRTLTIEITSLSENGCNDVGIRCSPTFWKVLTNSTTNITARVTNSSKPDTSIGEVTPTTEGLSFTVLQTFTTYSGLAEDVIVKQQWRSLFRTGRQTPRPRK